MCKLTVVVAIYNVGEYLDRCLNSLSKQSSGDYVVYCVNDGSSDNSRDVILKYVDNKKFFLFDKENGGASSTRNYGLAKCTSKFISFVDGDDYVSYDYVKTIIEHMESNDDDMLVFAYNHHYLADGSVSPIAFNFDEGIYNLRDKKELLAYTLNAPWNKSYKTSLFKDTKIEYPLRYRHQDLGTTPKLLLKANRIEYLNKSLYTYVVDRPNNVTGVVDKNINHIIVMCDEVVKYYINQGVFEEFKDELNYLVKRNLILFLRKAMRMNDKKFVYSFIDCVFDFENKYFNKSCKYQIVEEKGDDVYLDKFKCKLYYFLKHIGGALRG